MTSDDLRQDTDDAVKLLKGLAGETKAVQHRAALAFAIMTLLRLRKALPPLAS